MHIDVDELKRIIGRRIKTARSAAGMTQADLAASIEVDPQTISNWERGLRAPDAYNLWAITQTLGCTADFICGLSDVLEVD